MKKHNMVVMIIVIVFIIIVALNVFSEEMQDSEAMRDIISKKVIEICKEKGKVDCRGSCVDGFGQDCYFDAIQYKKEDLQIGISLPEATKDACFALRSYSLCSQCYNKFEVRKDGELKEVPCEEFYSVIKEKNNLCNNCVRVIYGGCC